MRPLLLLLAVSLAACSGPRPAGNGAERSERPVADLADVPVTEADAALAGALVRIAEADATFSQVRDGDRGTLGWGPLTGTVRCDGGACTYRLAGDGQGDRTEDRGLFEVRHLRAAAVAAALRRARPAWAVQFTPGVGMFDRDEATAVPCGQTVPRTLRIREFRVDVTPGADPAACDR